jgi:hypothetical protein
MNECINRFFDPFYLTFKQNLQNPVTIPLHAKLEEGSRLISKIPNWITPPQNLYLSKLAHKVNCTS